MHDDEHPREIAETCRLFPLPDLVFFPHAVLPLHIFEPRYRQMTEDALSTDNLITMVQLKPDCQGHHAEPKPIEEVGCLGKIIRYERLPDGRFNLLLVGLKRVLIRAELPADNKLYRVATAEILEDLPSKDPEARSRDRLITLFRKGFDAERGIDPDLQKLLDSDTIALGALTDIIAHALAIPPRFKQSLLAESSVDRRVSLLLEALGEDGNQGHGTPSRKFPPPFSLN